MSAPQPWSSYRYKAFISYSHADAESAQWLENSLESFRIPGELIGKWTPVGPVPNALRPVFRDRSSAAAGSSINTTLLQRLDESACLIVVCSPNAAKSRWVNEEILHFKRAGRGDRIFAFIVDGEPSSDDESGCFPPGLKYQIGADGELTDQAAAPLAADARKVGDGRRGALVKLVAGVLAVDLSDLQEKENELQRRQILAARLTAGVMAALFAGCSLMFGAFLQTDARSRLDVARVYARAAQIQNDRGNHTLAAMLALTSLPAAEPGLFGLPGGAVRQKPILPEAEVELARAMMANRRVATFPAHSGAPSIAVDRFRNHVVSSSNSLIGDAWTHELRLHTLEKDEFKTIDLDTGEGVVYGGSWSAYSHFYAVVRDARYVDVYFLETGERILTVDAADGRRKVEQALLLPSSDDKFGFNVLLIDEDTPARLIRPSTGLVAAPLGVAGDNDILGALQTNDTQRIATITRKGILQVRNADTLEVELEADTEGGQWLKADKEMTVIAAYDEKIVRVFDAVTGAERGVADFSEFYDLEENTVFKSIDISTDGELLLALYDNGLLRVYDTKKMELLAELKEEKVWSDRETARFLSSGRIAIGRTDGVVNVFWAPTREYKRLIADRTEGSASLSKAVEDIDGSLGGGAVVVSSVAGEINVIRTWTSDVYNSLTEFLPDVRAATQFRLSMIGGCSFYNPDGDRILSSNRISITSAEIEKSLRDEYAITPRERKNVVVVLRPFAERTAYLDAKAKFEAEGDGDASVALGPEPPREIVGILKGHSDTVTMACFSPKGDQILTIGEDAKAILWDAATYEKKAEFDHSPFFGDQKYFSFLTGSPAFARAGERFAVTDGLHRIHVWDIATGAHVSIIEGNKSHVEIFDFSADGEKLITVENSGVVAVWDARTGKKLRSRYFPGSLFLSVKVSPSGNALSVYDTFRGITVLDFRTLNVLAVVDQLDKEFLFMNKFLSDDLLVFFQHNDTELLAFRPLISLRGRDLVDFACGRLKNDARVRRYPSGWRNGVLSNEADAESFAEQMNGVEWTDSCRAAGILSAKWWVSAAKDARERFAGKD